MPVSDYLYPPRPSCSILPGDLGYYESSGDWLIQPKFNESRILTHILPAGEVVFWTRHHTRPTHIDAPLLSRELKRSLNLIPGVEYWIDGGVMNREKGAGGQLVFYDLLFQGRYLFLKMSQMERLSALAQICKDPVELNPEGTALRVGENLWFSTCFLDGFSSRLNLLLKVGNIEGVMLRKRSSFIDNYGRKQYEVSWMKRCRV